MISRLNFDIVNTHDFKTVGILDTSWYNPDIKVEEATIEILPPGYLIASTPFFMPGAMNVYNSNGVGITRTSCEDELIELPDGIWKVKYSICPNDKLYIEKYFLRVDKIICRYSQAFLNLDLGKYSDSKDWKVKMDRLKDIEFYIQGAIAASNNQDTKLATDLYNKADKLLVRYESEFNC